MRGNDRTRRVVPVLPCARWIPLVRLASVASWPKGVRGVTDAKVPTFAQRFRDAVWEAGPEELSTVETLVLLAYADHARGGDCAWVAQSRLIQRCKIRSKGTPSTVLAALAEKGWLVLLSPAQWRNRQSPTYRLVIPTSPSDREVSDGKPPRSKRQPPRSRAEPPRSVPQSSPSDGAKLPVNRVPLSSERPSGLSGGEATRPAPPRDAPLDDDPPAPPGPPGAAREAARAAALAAKRRDVVISHWKQLPPTDPNPQYNPARAAVLATDLPVFEFTPVVDEEARHSDNFG